MSAHRELTQRARMHRAAGAESPRCTGWVAHRTVAALEYPQYIPAMQVATGTVVDGKIVVEGVPLPEGAKVTVVTRGADEDFSLTEADEADLLESLDQIERGEFVTVEDLLASLPKADGR